MDDREALYAMTGYPSQIRTAVQAIGGPGQRIERPAPGTSVEIDVRIDGTDRPSGRTWPPPVR